MDEEAKKMHVRYHLCSWCGGRAEYKAAKDDEPNSESFYEFLKIEIPRKMRDPRKPDTLVACVNCYHKIFHNILGQPMYHGIEQRVFIKNATHDGSHVQRRGALLD